ncbi:SpoIIIAH-like family protein [Anaerobacillus sp. MEB173]|uniref:SpoIIIAH-like family protein n=1 Tax=Anaerobacillus sp. MEB173 TaxID=3383345 RepID=UPI003F90D858
MVLKKQTVWLLTMLSLIIVLSVYYITSPGQVPNEHLALLEVEENDAEPMEQEQSMVDIEEATEVGGSEWTDEDSVISNVTSDEVFASIRLDREVSRDRLSEQYTSIVADTETAEELRTQALEAMQKLQSLAQKEAMLETLIQAEGYEDVLVITEDDQVKIIVKAEELSREEGNKIILMAREQLGEKNVAVSFQPTKQ